MYNYITNNLLYNNTFTTGENLFIILHQVLVKVTCRIDSLPLPRKGFIFLSTFLN